VRRAILALAIAALPAAAEEPSCTKSCHGKEATEFRACVHEDVLSCVDCHKGDPAAVGDKEKAHAAASGFVGRFPRETVPALCGGCHSDPLRMHAYGVPTDQLEHYRTSAHGKALFGENDLAVAVCTDCHGTHRILRAADPRAPTAPANQPATCGKCHSDAALMGGRGLPSDTVDRFRNSVHGRALLEENLRGAPSCSDCHGSHGAAPPGAQDTVQACGNCHEATAEHYRKSPHYASADMSCESCHPDGKGPEYARKACATCHGAHDIAPAQPSLYEGDEVGRCGHCHREGGAPAELARAIREGGERLQSALEGSLREIADAKRQGVHLENERLYLRDSERALVSVRPLAHSLDAEAVRAHLEQGLKRQERSHEDIAKKRVVLRDRRLLTTALAAILLLLAGLLRAKLRTIRELS
jgi:hypothetical protein